MPENTDTPSMPSSVDAERAVLGGIILDNDTYLETSELVATEDFYLDSHRRIFGRMVELKDSGNPIDMVTLAEALDAHQELKVIGGYAYIASLLDGTIPENTQSYAAIVRDKALLRRVIHACNATAAAAQAPGAQAMEAMHELDEVLTRLNGHIPSRAHSLKELMPLVLNDMAQERSRENNWIGIPTGIFDLDELLGGIREGELWITGGLPSQGKTSLGLEHALAACSATDAVSKEIPTCIFSMEMRERRIVRRILAAKTKARAIGARDARAMPAEIWHQVQEEAAQLGNLPLYIDDSSGITIPMLRAKVRRYKKKFGLIFAIVDYVGLMDGPGRTITEQATQIAKGLQRIAKEEGVALLSLSQLHRPPSDNPNARPTMSWLRNSGDFEANADAVLLLHRPMDLDTSTFTGEDEIIIGKARDGARGSIPVVYDSHTLSFKPRLLGTQH